jgi:BASS family bile acid:Na+ symporter
MAALLAFLNRRASAVLASCLFVGILLPGLAAAARPVLVPAVTFLLASAILRMDWRRLAEPLARPLVPLLLVLFLMLAVPVAAAAIAAALPLPDALKLAIPLFATAPMLVSVTAYALMLGLDARLALVLLVGTSLLLPVVQPPLAIELGAGELMARLAGLVGGAFAAAWLARRVLGPARVAQYDDAIGGIGVLVLVLFALGAVDGLAMRLAAEPAKVALYLAAAFATNFGLQALAAALLLPLERFLGLARAQSLAAALAAGNRNFALLIGAMGVPTQSDLFLFFTCVQFPIYMIPALLGPLYRRALAAA